ncbi:retrovirus-related pol polyprotein from transposon TNT 1-94, partial [Tanacetum coccineum]
MLNAKDYLTKFDPKSYKGVFLGYSQNSKACIVLNKHTIKVEESLNVTFDESPPPTKLSPLVDDDVGEEKAIKKNTKLVNNNNKEDESIKVDEVVNIKESKNHPLDQVIGNLNQRTLRSQAQNHSNFFCFISTIEPKNVNEALKDKSWVITMQEELNQFVANEVWDLVPLPMIQSVIGTKWVLRNKLDENGIVSRNKARLVVQGYNQQEGIDYDETYAPVARRNKNPVAAQQVAFDNALVAPEKLLKIEKCNMRIEFNKPQRETTYQVTLDVLKLSPYYPAFLITAEIIYTSPGEHLLLSSIGASLGSLHVLIGLGRQEFKSYGECSTAESFESENESWGDSGDEADEQNDEYVHTPKHYVPTDDETNDELDDVTKEEYERTNEELYGDVNISLTDVEPADKEKINEEMIVAGHVNVNQEGAGNHVTDDAQATQKTKVPIPSSSISSDYAVKYLNFDNIPPVDTEVVSMLDINVQHEVLQLKTVDHSVSLLLTIKSEVLNAVKEYLGTSLGDALYKVLKKHDADIIKEHSVPAEIVERL